MKDDMKGDIFIIDAVGHGIDFSQANRVVEAPPDAVAGFEHYAHRQFMGHLELDRPGFRLNQEQFTERWTAEELAHAFFVESDVDLEREVGKHPQVLSVRVDFCEVFDWSFEAMTPEARAQLHGRTESLCLLAEEAKKASCSDGGLRDRSSCVASSGCRNS